ncbi:MAG: hypothetical protein MI976_23020 [Pseudomonadales bacterium]|nr:hypothetical protein [Pseudomonadales bacterium]
MKNIAPIAFSLAAVSVAASATSVPSDILERGWKPQVDLIGSGNSEQAIANLRDITELQTTVFKHTEVHEQTQEFIDELWESLESFNLNRYYSLLPEEDGEWRQLSIYGARKGSLYQVGPIAADVGHDGLDGKRDMGDFSAVIKAKRLEAENGDTHYLMKNTVELGVGQLQWDSVQQAAQETFRILSDGAPTFSKSPQQEAPQSEAAQVYRDKVIRMNPQLGTEDIDIIAPLWAAFPAMWQMLADMGKVEDVVYDNSNNAYRKLNLSFVIEPEKLSQNYPAMSDYILKMNRVLSTTLHLSDERGELLTVHMDSQTRRMKLQMFLADGRIIPTKGFEVLLDAPPIPEGVTKKFSLRMDVTASMLGVTTYLQDFKARLYYRAEEDGVKTVTQINELPNINITGNALGIIPTSMIDVVLPKNMDKIMKEFMGVACRGNEGKGIVMGAEFEQAKAGESAKLTFKSAFEGIDNFFVRFGMGFVSDRVIPDEKASEEFRQFFFDTQEAFVQDLNGFEKITALETSSQQRDYDRRP